MKDFQAQITLDKIFFIKKNPVSLVLNQSLLNTDFEYTMFFFHQLRKIISHFLLIKSLPVSINTLLMLILNLYNFYMRLL